MSCKNTAICSVFILFAAPSEPQSFGVTVVNSSAVFVSWEEPAMINGILSRYTLYYSIGGVGDSMPVENMVNIMIIFYSLL